MKNPTNFKKAFLSLLFLIVSIGYTSCNNRTETNSAKKAEKQEQEKVGNVYDEEQQGPGHENRDNQFPSSRNDNKQGTGLETGAPSDTTRSNTTN